MKSKKAWAIFTPKGRLELDSIRAGRKDCVRQFIKRDSGYTFLGCPLSHWKERFESNGYTCRKVTITEVVK